MTVNLNGKSLFYTDNGNGTACVLLHGFLENHDIWSPIIQALGDTHRFIAIDLPGHGESDPIDGEVHMDDYAAAVAAVLDVLGIDAANFIGHSMGGYVGLAFAKAYLPRTLGLLLLNSTFRADDAERVKNRKHGIEVARKNYTAIVRMSIANLFTETFSKNHELEIAKAQSEALKTPLTGYVMAQKAMMHRPEMTQFWKTAMFKKMIILGSEDSLIDTGDLKKELKGANTAIKVISGGHLSLIENPSAVVEGVEQFLDQ